jgi:hypothetical protein
MIVLPPGALDFLKPKRPPKPEHVPSADGWASVHTLALKWGCSNNTVSRRLEKYRGREGFMDRGSKGSTKTHTRKYAVLAISPQLVLQIEADMRGKLS